MKLRWYDRILVALGGLVLVALGSCVILAAGGVITLPEAIAFDSWLGDGWQWMPLVFLAGALIVVWGLWLFIRPFRRGSEAGGRYYTLENKDDGDVRISVHAIDHMVRRCVEMYEQIVSAKIRIGGQEDAMQITLHLTLRPDVRIPELVEALREEIKRHLERSAGVTVKNVRIYVDATKGESNGEDIRYIGAGSTAAKEEPAPVPEYTRPTPVEEPPATEEPEPIWANEPKVDELEKEIDLGPDEPLPADLSAQAFPFPEEEAGVPLEIYTEDVPFKDEDKDEPAGGDVEDDAEEDTDDV